MKPTTPIPTWKKALAPALAGLLLLAMGASNFGFPDAADAEPYHEAVLSLVDEAPKTFGPWDSRPVDLPASAIQLLKPNATLSRKFHDKKGRRRAELLIVQCKDARDLGGHWPPNCYKTSGFTQTAQQSRDWSVDGVALPGIEYTFEKATSHGEIKQVVANFLILPGVGYVPDMDSVRTAGADYTRRHFGAAQVQVITPASYTPQQREQIFIELVGAHLPLIRGIAELDTP